MASQARAADADDTRSNDADEIDSIVVRFAGDSGDGMQLTGGQFTLSTALAENDLATFPNFPAEIRAPQGTLFGVSSFQINFGTSRVDTAGDQPDVLFAMNPAALKTCIGDLRKGGLVIADSGEFSARNLKKAYYNSNPLEDGSLADYQLLALDISARTLDSVKPFGLGNKDALRCKNMWTLGLALWMFGRDRAPLVQWLRDKFAKAPELAEANIAALNAGHAYGETTEIATPVKQYKVAPTRTEAGLYRTISGTDAIAFGLVAAAKLSGLHLFFGSYPITPASNILHALAQLHEFGVTTFQAEDEIAAIGSAIGASWGGDLAVTSSSGPGLALKTEAMGLAIMAELPLVIVNSQRGGPSTGLPTKTEQSDLYQAVYGRNGDASLPVIAARSPSDCFDATIEACRIALKYMTPVILLSDGYIGNATEPWLIPDEADYKPFPVQFYTDVPESGRINPFSRDPETLARLRIKPGTPGLMHRLGGLEKSNATGDLDYSPANHQQMTMARKAKVDGVARDIPRQKVEVGNEHGRLAVVGWGSTYGPIRQAVNRVRRAGHDVAHIHVRHIWPLPANLGELLRGFDHVLVPEMNTGQFKTLLRDQYLIDAKPLNKVAGQPFRIEELEQAILEMVGK